MASRTKPARRTAPTKRSRAGHAAAPHHAAKTKPRRVAAAKKAAGRHGVIKQVRLAGHRGHGAELNIHTAAKHNRLRTASIKRQHLTIRKTRRV